MKRADRTVCIILFAIALAVLYILSVFIVVRVSGSSMEPTFKDGMVVMLELAMPAYNILRMIGDESIGPNHPVNYPVKRRRIFKQVCLLFSCL